MNKHPVVTGISQLILIAVISYVVFWIPNPGFMLVTFLPAALPMLVWLVVIAILAQGFPGSKYMPSKIKVGLINTIILLILASLTNLALMSRWPLFPTVLFWGVPAFTVALIYSFNWMGWPFAGKVPAWSMYIIGSVISFGIGSMIYFSLENYSFIPGFPFDPQGLYPAPVVTAILAVIIVWNLLWGNVFAWGMYPFSKLKQPAQSVTATIFFVVMGFITYKILSVFMNPIQIIGAFAAPLIMFTVLNTLSFDGWPGRNYENPIKKGVTNTVFIIIAAAIWFGITYSIVSVFPLPPPFTVYDAVTYMLLAVQTPIVIVHTVWWLRTPLTPPPPPS